LHKLLVEWIPIFLSHGRGGVVAAGARIGIDQATDKAELLNAALQLRDDLLDVAARRLWQAADALECIGMQLALPVNQIVATFDVPRDDLFRLLMMHLSVGPRR